MSFITNDHVVNPSGDNAELAVIDLGRMAYRDADVEQQRAHGLVVAGQPAYAGLLLLVEHDPVITVSRRRGAAGHLIADATRLAELGIDVQSTDRGGDITYHGPGQLVAYPILPLAHARMSIGRYMRWLEETVIDTLAAFGVTGCREEGFTGVWTQGPHAAKLCAMGVRLRRQVTLHGLALNVDPDLSHFQTIVPCGLAGRHVTSLRQLLGDRTPDMTLVKTELARTMRRRWSMACSSG
ncbi:MAG: lipoyl(octanoyl) transferase LipB [Phycisphaeraceae bacterium]|nr:lipoyl(octanoyl) transferase LipB [Phycisphaeraceae bacterium]